MANDIYFICVYTVVVWKLLDNRIKESKISELSGLVAWTTSVAGWSLFGETCRVDNKGFAVCLSFNFVITTHHRIGIGTSVEGNDQRIGFIFVVVFRQDGDVVTLKSSYHWRGRSIFGRRVFTPQGWIVTHARKFQFAFFFQNKLMNEVGHLSTEHDSSGIDRILWKHIVVMDEIYKWFIPTMTITFFYVRIETSQGHLETFSNGDLCIRLETSIPIAFDDIFSFGIADIVCISFIFDIRETVSTCAYLRLGRSQDNLQHLCTRNATIWTEAPIRKSLDYITRMQKFYTTLVVMPNRILKRRSCIHHGHCTHHQNAYTHQRKIFHNKVNNKRERGEYSELEGECKVEKILASRTHWHFYLSLFTESLTEE